MGRLQKVFFELRRREVFRAAGVYIVGSWVVLQVAALAFQSLDVPNNELIWVWFAIIVGFPLALVFAWRYDLTTKGIVRTPVAENEGSDDLSLRATDYAILVSLAAVAVITGAKTFVEVSDVDVGLPGSAIRGEVPPNSVAVLPLENLSGDPQQEYFVIGMQDALIAALTRISGLKVISRSSTGQYRNSPKTELEIGLELGASKIIEGSVLRVKDEVRITVHLFDALANSHVWSDSYQRNLSDILQLQSDVAREIAEQVSVRITPDENEALTETFEVDAKAYELYLKGRFHWYRFGEGDLELALNYFQQAIEQDPYYALAYVGFADALATPAHAGMMPTTKVFPAAKGFVKRALELDPDLAEAHDFLARIHFTYDWDWEAAEREFRRSISLNSGYPDVHVVFSQFLGITNRRDESLREAEIGLSLDPLNPWFRMELAHRLVWLGRYEEAREEISTVIDSQPDIHLAYEILWIVEHQQRRHDEALQAASRYFELIGESGVASILREPGADYIEVMKGAAEILESNSARQYVSNVEHARLRVHANEADLAIEHLQEARFQRETALVYTTVDPQFRPLWDDQRYQVLRREMNLP
jgi:TolB-like protein/Tfp pilus assembly protein PilF